jgi:Galactose oxidase, central domain
MSRCDRVFGLARLLSALLLGNGCTLVINPDQYLAPRIDADGPSAPSVSLTPNSPSSDVELVASITTPSIDPRGGTVRYEYRWLRGASVIAGQSSERLPASLTTRGDIIAVEVTPFADSRRGAPGRAEVTIENATPVLSTLGLDHYDLRVGESVRVLPGPVVDADGDTTTLRLQWYRGQEPIAGATLGALSLAEFEADEMLSVEGIAKDVEDGPVFRLGPIPVRAATTTWRQLLDVDPNELTPTYFYDEPHRRALQVVHGRAWELVIEGDRIRSTRLPNLGTAPPVDAGLQVVHDTERRALYAIPADGSSVYTLDLRARGLETWSVATAGSGAPTEAPAGSVYDPRTQCAYGLSASADSQGLWKLDLSDPARPVWSRLITQNPLGALTWGSLALHPREPSTLYVVGVARFTGAGIEPSDAVWEITLGDSSATARSLGSVLPSTLILPAIFSDGESGKIVLAGGLRSFNSTPLPSGVIVFDPAAGTASTLVSPGVLSALGFIARDPDGEGLLFGHATDVGTTPRFQLDVLRDDFGSVTMKADAVRPPRVSRALGHDYGREATIAMGRAPDGAALESSWLLSFDEGTWTQRPLAPDVSDSSLPRARYDVVVQTDYAGTSSSGFLAWGGATNGDALVDDGAWEERGSAGRLTHQTLVQGSPIPPLRQGHALTELDCDGESVMAIFGGRDGGARYGDLWTLSCVAHSKNCTWTEVSASGPTPRSHASLTRGSRTYLLFGGETAAGASSELFVVDPCGAGPAFSELTPRGSSPPARWGHSAALAAGPGGSDVLLFFGGTNGTRDLADLYLLTQVDGVPTWTAVAVPGEGPAPRAHHTAFWDERNSRLIVYGGETFDGSTLGDLWVLLVTPF